MYKNSIFVLAQLVIISVLTVNTAYSQASGTLVETLAGKEQGEGRGDSFGDHVISTEEFIFVGAPREDNPTKSQGHIDKGALYIYRREGSTISMHQVIEGANVPGNDLEERFGCGIAAMGDYLFIGVANDQDFPKGLEDPGQVFSSPDDPPFFFAGQVHVFKLNQDTNNWEGPIQKLTSDTPASRGGFGCRTDSSHIALFDTDPSTDDPDLAVIGESGSIGISEVFHVFSRNGSEWVREQVIEPPGGRPAEPFIQSFADGVVAIGSEHLLVTERNNDTNFEAVHLYGVSSGGVTPLPIQTLTAPASTVMTPECFGGFGDDGIAASGDTVVITHACDSSNPQGVPAAGRINVYHYNPRIPMPLRLIETLYHPNPGAGDLLGANLGGGVQAVDTNGDLIVVGSPFTRFLASTDVLVFQRSGPRQWNTEPAAIIELTDIALLFGQSVELVGPNTVAVSHLGSFDTGGGRVRLYDIF